MADQIDTPTQLRGLYSALSHLKQSEEVALAQAHAKDVSMLEHRIKQDLETVGGYPVLREALVDDKRKSLPETVDVAHLRSTVEFAAALGAGPHAVTGRPDLGFRYLQREVSPLRGGGVARRAMDLLLLSSDGTPILGEFKLGPDSLPYFALIQLLVHLVELSSPAQRERLVPLGIPPETSGEPMDLYLLAYGKPHATYSEASLAATKAISERLVQGRKFEDRVRRIAYLHAEPEGDALSFRCEFVAE